MAQRAQFTYPQHRPVTMATAGVVAAPHYLAAQAGLDMLKAGGNALDAAIATNAVLQVVYPFVVGLGGDLFLLYHDASGREVYGLNGSGRSPATATIERYHELGYTEMPRFGIHTVTVPGVVDGWARAMERFGRLGLDAVLQPAIRYARDGFPVGPGLHRALTFMRGAPHTHRSFLETYLPDGVVPPVGSIARAPQLARSLEAIAAHGRDVFYRGAIAEQIAAFFAREGGLITQEDLAAHEGAWVQPLSVPFAGLELLELPPNTQGVTALQMLGMLDELPLGASPTDALTVHVGVEVKKLAFADRARYLTDREHMRVDPERLIAPSYLRERAAQVDRAGAGVTVAATALAGDTVYMCAADGEGNACSLIQSNFRGFGSGYVVDGTGITLQNRGSYFSLDPEKANVLAPNKRTLHTLIPSMALRNGRLAIVFGAMGGDGQAQTHAQVYTALARFGLNIQAAIELPRWVHGEELPGEGEVLRLEERFGSDTLAALAGLGHRVVRTGPWDSAMGHAHGIVVDQETGVLHGGSDPRAEGAAVGW
jgi:gamma-glutamyltranspeptidase/glutathione hydrolase